MKEFFVSVSIKLFVLVVSALVLLGVAISILSITRLNQEFTQYQEENLRQGHAQFDMQSQIVREQIGVWLESFTNLVHTNGKPDFYQMKTVLEQQIDELQINHNVESLWLTSESLHAIYQSAPLTEQVIASVKRVISKNTPDYHLVCEQKCLQLISIPILNGKSDMAIVTMAVSLVDIIFAINQASKNQVAIVSFDKSADTTLAQAKIITSSAPKLIAKLFSQSQSVSLLFKMQKESLKIEHGDITYLINLLPLASSNSQNFYIVEVDDVSSFTKRYQDYRLQFVLSAITIVIVIALLVHFVATPLTKRLLVLSDVLPLLARKEFDQFRKVEMSQSKLFPDEVDILVNATIDLSYELEQLNIEITNKNKELENIAMYDPLTGLPNRNMLNYTLCEKFKDTNCPKENIGILFLDLDDFKKVNDSHGHGEGDKLIVEAGNRISLSVICEHMLCRFGGDEFVILLNVNTSVEDAQSLANSIIKSFQHPIKIGSSLFYVTCSIGIAMAESAGTQASELISRADIAMYEAKTHGGDRYVMYQGDMFQRVALRVMMESEVKQALAKGQFSLSLQPQFVAKTNKLHGFEALLRWQHPERGLVSPEDFIPILENSEHMIELGYWVIRRCFELYKDMRERGLVDVVIAINLTAAQFADINLIAYLKSLLDEFKLPAKNFELELTEQTLVKEIDKAIETMFTIRSLGFSFAIDDFGTGYSSLAYLKRMPVDVIKIDQSFVFGMLDNHADFQIIMSTIAMVKNLGLTVIAEGVETQAQLQSLTENNCDLIQGFYFSKPVCEDQLFDFINEKIVDGYWETSMAL